MTMLAFAVLLVCAPVMESHATQAEEASNNPLGFEIAIFEYEVVEEATQDDMPVGFTVGEVCDGACSHIAKETCIVAHH